MAKGIILRAISGRGATDEMLSTTWILIPVIGLALVLGLLLISFLTPYPLGVLIILFVILALAVVVLVFLLILTYKLIKRQSDHIGREAQMRRALIDYLRTMGEEKKVSNGIGPYISAMDAIDKEMSFNEKARDPFLWTILSIIPFVNWYVLYFLTDFTYDHDRRLNAFAQNAQMAGAQIGVILAQPNWRPVHERNFILYLILSVLTGLFYVFWYYVLIMDMNDHFTNEWLFEDQLAREMQRT